MKPDQETPLSANVVLEKNDITIKILVMEPL
jgi:hypothetical protein